MSICQEEHVKAMQKTQTGQRWLGVAFVLVAAVAVVGIKALNRPDQVAGLSVAETAADADVPALGAESPDSKAEAGVPAQEADPFPSDPAAQIEWVLRKGKPAMILFHSTTCKPCQLMEKAVEKVRAEFEPQIAFVDVVVTDPANATLLRQAQIRTIPTSVFVMTSGQAYGFVGAVEEDALRAELNKLVSGD
jgi:thiol-disulfide isomerase/thioredoxin